MKRIILVVIAILMMGSPAVVSAAQIGTCVVAPSSASAGSTFTATCSGWAANEALSIGWSVDQPNGTTVWSGGGPHVADAGGNLTVSQVVPIAGQGHFHALPPQNYKKVAKNGFVGFYSDFVVTS